MGYTPPQLEVRKITGGYEVFPPTMTSGDDVTIFPNGTDKTNTFIQILGDQSVSLAVKAGYAIYLRDTSYGYMMKVSYTSPDCIWESDITDKNIYIKPKGTGYLKVGGTSGTYVAGAATDSTGYLPFLDSGGTVRKMMVQA